MVSVAVPKLFSIHWHLSHHSGVLQLVISQCRDSPSSSFIFISILCHLLFFVAFAFTLALCSHVPSSFSLTAVVLDIIYDIYTTFHVAVYIPTLIKQFVPGNSMNNHIVECIEAKINGA